jgi:hypothetical protein
MVCYLYHKDYQDDEDCQSDTSEPNGSLSAEDQAFETTLNRIVVNIDVYALAEKYDVPPLRALAKAKFTALVCRIRRHEDFSPVFLAIYESSVRRGLELRVIVSRICASRMRAVIDNAQLNGSVKENGNLGRHGSIKKEVERRMRELGLL